LCHPVIAAAVVVVVVVAFGVVIVAVVFWLLGEREIEERIDGEKFTCRCTEQQDI